MSSSAKLKTAVDNQTLLKAVTGLQQPKHNILPIHLKQEEPLPWQSQQSRQQGLLRAPHDQCFCCSTCTKVRDGGKGVAEWGWNFQR